MVPGRKYSLGVILRILWRQKFKFALSGLLGMTVGAASVSRLPVLYRANATLLVQPSLVPQNYVRPSVTQDIETQVRSLGERVLPRERLKSVLAGLASEADLDALIRTVQSNVRVDVVRADAFRIALIHSDPVLAAKATGRLALAFIEENLRSRTGLAEEADQFVDAQLQSTRERLSANEKRLEEYRRTYAGQLPSQLASNLQVMQHTQTQLQSVMDAMRDDRERKLRLDEKIAELSLEMPAPAEVDSGEPAPEIDFLSDAAQQLRGEDARRQLPTARATLRRLELQLKPDHPDIVRLKRVIAELERRVEGDGRPAPPRGRDAVDAGRRKVLAELQAEAAAVQKRVEARTADETRLRAVITRYQERLELAPSRETELTSLMRDYDTLRETYRNLLVKKEESKMGAELERRRVGETLKIVTPPRVPDRPFSPRKEATMLGGATVGLALAFLLVAWREYQDSTFRAEREIVAALDLPVLALVPVIVRPDDSRRSRRMRIALLLAVLGVVAAVAYVRLTNQL